MRNVLIAMTSFVVLSILPGLIFGIGRARALSVAESHVSAADASTRDTILQGVYIGPVDVSGLTEDEARAKVEAFVEEMRSQKLTVNIGDTQDTLPIADIDFTWVNQDAPHEAVMLGKSGNIVERFKEIRDIEAEPYRIDLVRSVDESVIEGFIGQEIEAHEKKAVDAGLIRNDDGTFTATAPEIGLHINEHASLMNILTYLTTTWQGETPMCSMSTEVLNPRGSKEELLKIKDVLGEGTTDYSSSSSARAKNVKNGTEKVNGHVVYPGDTFSVLENLVPFDEDNGYDLAPAYANGRTEDSFGGGICQVSTTLYLAVLRAELEVVERHNHSMTVSYVKPSMDAAIAESSDKDFVFRNTTDSPIYVDAHASDGYVTMKIYGVERRDANRTVEYESEVLSTESPEGISLVASSEHGLGYIKYAQSAHDGMNACLWKIEKENGEEVSREQINTSEYNAAKETYIIGVASGSNEATSAMYRAIDQNSLSAVNSVIDSYGTYRTSADND